MDPLTIATTLASVATLCLKTVCTLTKWTSEVSGIEASIGGFRGEIESVGSVVVSLDAAIKGQKEGEEGAARACGSGEPTTYPRSAVHKVVQHGYPMYWHCLKRLIERGHEAYRDLVPMAQLVAKLYTEHWLMWKSEHPECRGTRRAAIASSNTRLVEILLDAGFDAWASLDDGRTPVMTAIQTGNREMMALVQRHEDKMGDYFFS